MSPTLSGLVLLACLASPFDGELTIEGVVLAPDGTPAVGARCIVSSRADVPFFFKLPVEVFSDEVIGEGGRFQLRIPESWIGRCSQSPLDLWIWREDLCLELVSYRVKDLPVGELVTIRTRGPQRETITVLDEKGEPVPGARITPRQYGYSPVPEGLADALSMRTDERGRVVPGSWDPQRVANLAVETEPHGRHTFGGGGDGFAGQTLQLGAVGRLRLEVVGEAPPLPPELRLSVQSYPRTEDQDVVVGYGEVDLPLSGGAMDSSRPLAAGSANPRLSLPEALERVPRITGGLVEAGETFKMRVEWLAGVPASGRVVDADTGEPVAGVKLWINGYPLTFPVVSGADGTFEFRALPGALAIVQIDAPRPYASESEMSRRRPKVVEVDAEAGEVRLGDIEVSRARGIEGRVVNGAGEPVAGAWVYGSQRQSLAGGMITSVPVAAVTDERGTFRIGGSLTAEEDVEIAARLGYARTRSAEKFPVGAEVELVLVDDLLLPLKGTVRDRSGRPVVGATVSIWKAYEEWPSQAEDEVLIDGSRLVTNSVGEFTGSSCIDPGGNYTLVITSPETERTATRWMTGEELRNEVAVNVPRLVPLRGRLLTADGSPRIGVPLRVTSAFGPAVTAVTDSAGQFELEGVHPDGALVLAELEGLGLRGRWFGEARGGDWIVADDEAALQALPPPVSRERELALARELSTSRLQAALAAGEESDIRPALRVHAWVDPTATLEALDRGVIDDQWRDSVLREVVRALVKSDPEEALVVAGSMELGMSSVLARLEVAENFDPEQGNRRIEIIGLALAEARRIDTPAYRLVCLARIAELLRDLGEEDTGRELLEEGRAIATELPPEGWSGYARAVFAEELAVYELDTALELIAEMSDRNAHSRHYGNIALELAGVAPESAEEVLGRVSEWSRGRAAPGICYRMAQVDLDRARRIADRGNAPEAYGYMARSLADEDPAVARELLETAFQKLADRVGGKRWTYLSGSGSALAGSLLPLAEEIAPDRVREYLWQAVALRWKSTESNPRPESRSPAQVKDGALAFFVARYDDELARALVAPALELFRKRPELVENRSGDWNALYAALVEIDPEWAVGLAEELLPARARGVMVNVLARQGEARRQYVMNKYLSMWIPGDEDL